MIDVPTCAWFAAGIMAGLLHALMLGRATQQLTVWTPVWGILRLSVVGAVLVLAALSSEILAAAAGWAAGFVARSAWFVISRSHPSFVSANTHSPE